VYSQLKQPAEGEAREKAVPMGVEKKNAAIEEKRAPQENAPEKLPERVPRKALTHQAAKPTMEEQKATRHARGDTRLESPRKSRKSPRPPAGAAVAELGENHWRRRRAAEGNASADALYQDSGREGNGLPYVPLQAHANSILPVLRNRHVRQLLRHRKNGGGFFQLTRARIAARMSCKEEKSGLSHC